jgi:hypothetical protein
MLLLLTTYLFISVLEAFRVTCLKARLEEVGMMRPITFKDSNSKTETFLNSFLK